MLSAICFNLDQFLSSGNGLMVIWESYQLIGKNVVWRTGKISSRKDGIGALAMAV